jgi:hypothetical protein
MKQTIFLLGCVLSAIGCILGAFYDYLYFGFVFLGLLVCGIIIKKLDKDE